MRKLLVLAFLLYDIIAIATRANNYDYDEMDPAKRHYMQQIDERRNWRKKAALTKPIDDHRDWERRRYEYDQRDQRYMDDPDSKSYNAIERQRDRGPDRGPDRGLDRGPDRGLDRGPERGPDRSPDRGPDRGPELDIPPGFRHRKYDDPPDKMPMAPGMKSSEVLHPSSMVEKDMEKKVPLELNCQRPHEKYESCFAGCASVTCDNPRDRMQPCYPFCEAGCVCVSPYVRDDRTHKCVLPEDCTKGLKGIPDLGEEAST